MRLWSWRRRAVLALGAVAAIAMIAAARTGLVNEDILAAAMGFGIDQVSLTGHRFTPDNELFDALDMASARSMASFDAAAIGKRFERLPWVKSVEISRVWPNQLSIRVSERRPFAIWMQGETAELIDQTGRRLGPVKPDAALDLPRISGEGANIAAAQLFTALDRFSEIRSRLVRATRHGERRWTLELTGNSRIHLPSEGEATALARLSAEPGLASLISQPGQLIDLRSPSKIAIRNAATAGGGEG